VRTVTHNASDKLKIVVDMSNNCFDLILHGRNLGLSVSDYNKLKAYDIKIVSKVFRPIWKEEGNGSDQLCNQKLHDLHCSCC
jgi:hypothetical protein